MDARNSLRRLLLILLLSAGCDDSNGLGRGSFVEGRSEPVPILHRVLSIVDLRDNPASTSRSA